MERYWNIFVEKWLGNLQYTLQEIVTPSLGSFFWWLILVSVFFLALEWLRPWRKDQPKFRQDFWLDLFYMFFTVTIFGVIIHAAGAEVVVTAFRDLLATMGLQSLEVIRVDDWPVWAQLLSLFVLRDFIQWNIHRLLHRVPFLWQFHKVHHSVEQMGFAAQLRFHWMEIIVYRTLEYLPLALIGFGIDDFFIVYVFTLAWGHFNHANFTIPLGPLKYIFNNPRMHIWHHVRQTPAGHPYGVNFGLTLSLWDYLFGTAHIPHDGRDIDIGVSDQKEFPKTFWGQLVYPFRKPPSHHDSHDDDTPPSAPAPSDDADLQPPARGGE